MLHPSGNAHTWPSLIALGRMGAADGFEPSHLVQTSKPFILPRLLHCPVQETGRLFKTQALVHLDSHSSSFYGGKKGKKISVEGRISLFPFLLQNRTAVSSANLTRENTVSPPTLLLESSPKSSRRFLNLGLMPAKQDNSWDR